MAPPTIGAAVDIGLEDNPDTADDCATSVEVLVATFEVQLPDDDIRDGSPLSNILNTPDEVGVAERSLCAIGMEVIKDTVRRALFEEGDTDLDISPVLVLEAATGVTDSTRAIGATEIFAAPRVRVEDVLVLVEVSDSEEEAIEVVGLALDVALVNTAT